ncbi:YgjP-like metallopeptidase domain-containing protein [Sphingobacterium hungaricum]
MSHRFIKRRCRSCSMNGKILLNREFIKSSKSCIEYEILHELRDLKERNH